MTHLLDKNRELASKVQIARIQRERTERSMKMWKRIATWMSLVLAMSAAATRAEHTRRWRQSTYEEFMKGTTHGIAVRSDGKLEIAPQYQELADADASYLWGLRLGPKGMLYAVGGSPAKVFQLDKNGKLSTVFASSELTAQAIAFNAKGELFVGTSPDGKVYRVGANGEKSVFFDPKTKYIWDLAFGPDGTLYVATGDKGQIFAVAPDGKGELYYASDEAHIRVLAFDHSGNLIAGTEPSGRVLRLTSTKQNPSERGKDKTASLAKGFVLYETPKREVTALAVAPDGTIYAAAIGERQHNAAQSATTIVTPTPATTTITSGGAVTVIGSPAGIVQGQTPFVAFPPLLTSAVYKISPDGAPQELWSSRDEVVYSLGIAANGQLLAGTGNNGAVLAIDGKGVFAQLAKAGAAQITGIARSAEGKIFLCTANPGKLAALGPGFEKEGTYESTSFDAQLFSHWGRLEWWGPGVEQRRNGSPNASSGIEFFVRSGNTEDPGKEWSAWFGPYVEPGKEVGAPPARFVQWKAVIHDGGAGDDIDWVSLAYQPRNVAPVIDAIVLQDPGVRAEGVPTVTLGQSPTVALKMPPTTSTSGANIITVQASSSTKFEAPPQGFRQKGWQSVLWSAHDDNDDNLRYAVYYRAEGDKGWILLKDKLEQRYYSFDTNSLPDGSYYLKVVADDSPSNPPAIALKTEKESDRFVVDNTPPVIEDLEVTANANSGQDTPSATAHIAFTAKDKESAIDRAQYSLDGGDWILLAPKTGISDSPEESYDFNVANLKAGEHSIAVRAFDQFENVGTGKATVTITGAKP
jgi:sugar lactone lactonase YvrE